MAKENSLTGKVHAELLALEKELSTLKHYTNDIGRARENAETMAQAMEALGGRLGNHVDRMVKILEESEQQLASDLKAGMERLKQVGDHHEQRLTAAGKLAEQTGEQARKVLGQVEGLEGNLREADMPGSLKRVGQELNSLQKKLSDDLSMGLAALREEQNQALKAQDNKLTAMQEEVGMTKVFAIIACVLAAVAAIGAFI
ncbi:MAG: hypothetical protein KDC02_19510 [Flavobacteriales bacterium]|nr:hypothetical protein [Flavobacteriales bacterium]